MVTCKADNRSRVKLPGVKPGQVFAIEGEPARMTLTEVKPVSPRPIRGRIEKRGKRLVGITDRPINMDALKQALAEFP